MRKRPCFQPLLALFALLFSTGCLAPKSLPPEDLSGPRWRTWQGQAVWQPGQNRPELAGELLAAVSTTGDCFVQFSKNPFPLATARISGKRWSAEYGMGRQAWAGRGLPPSRIVWFELARMLQGAGPAGGWKVEGRTEGPWRLVNPRTGEVLEGSFFP